MLMMTKANNEEWRVGGSVVRWEEREEVLAPPVMFHSRPFREARRMPPVQKFWFTGPDTQPR